MSKPLLFLIAALFSPNLLATTAVEAFLEDPLPILDDQGKSIRDIASANLPKGSVPVLQYNKELDLVQVELSGEKVWLDPMTVRVNPPLNVVKLPCQKLSSSLPEDHQNNSTIGFGAGCAK
ncbi:hypothetical protein F3J45_15200 [Pantoea sp. Ap-967]|uniref:hypothetical protein n=1 Tax=Pantoea sp. Ap-967 TaxID=2608362 RepID=UPI001422F12A|nr:hypothetical protein [Pantoea sp. Ap-967]NIE75787.1 hypothetical protein [Pantoea sp. Ap-967]